MRPNRPHEEEILLWCGVIAQLVRTRANRILQTDEIPYPLFTLLRHFCHDPDREWTVSSLATAFETPQPGMTKKVQRLVDLGLLKTRVDAADARVRWLRVSRRGILLRDKMVGQITPDQRQFFEGWKKNEVRELHRLLKRLKTSLDEDRDSDRR